MEYHHLVLADRPAEGNTFRVLYAESPEGWYELNLDTGVGQGYQIIQQVGSGSNLTLLVKKMAEGWVPATVVSTNIIAGTADGQLGEWVRRVEPFSLAAAATQAPVPAPNQRREKRPFSKPTGAPVPLVQNPKQFAVPVQMVAPLQSPNCIPMLSQQKHSAQYKNKHGREHRNRPVGQQMQPRCKIVI